MKSDFSAGPDLFFSLASGFHPKKAAKHAAESRLTIDGELGEFCCFN